MISGEAGTGAMPTGVLSMVLLVTDGGLVWDQQDWGWPCGTY